MTRIRRSLLRGAALVGAVSLSLSCWIVHRVAIDEKPVAHGDSVTVTSPIKVHLVNGHTIVYPEGATILRDTIRGSGTRFDLRLRNPVTVKLVSLDSVLGMENYRTEVNGEATFGYSALTTVAIPLVAVAIACAIDPKCFGSCPTYYSDSAGVPVLEAEGFSYSIAPLFEARDVDRLRARPDSAGVLRLEIRNEAYETHYLNHLELLEVRHSPTEQVVPDPSGRLLAVRDLRSFTRARDAAGHELSSTLAAADGNAFQTDPATLARAAPNNLEDTIELVAPIPAGADSVALVARMRNSLLNTVLLYDVMLGDAGARALDWLPGDLNRIGPAVQLGQWYVSRMGMGVAVQDQDGKWETVGRIRDTGPVAWKDIGIVLPRGTGDSLRVRLTFVADNWRIDRLQVATGVRRPTATAHPLDRVLGANGLEDTTAVAGLMDPDTRYLQTQPGQFFTATWQTGAVPNDSGRTFLLASQGYYVEWIRRGWIRDGHRATPFAATDSTLAGALARYRRVKDSLEVRFAATRVPVR